jgi:hypothetical protein
MRGPSDRQPAHAERKISGLTGVGNKRNKMAAFQSLNGLKGEMGN